jgi:serine/threonine-protein kinase RsbW
MTGSGSDKTDLPTNPPNCEPTGWHFDQSLESDPDQCALVIAKLLEQLDRFEWTNRDVFAIHMSMEESILNAIRHGNCCAPNKRVQVRIDLDSSRFYAKITDEGSGFKLEDIPDPTLEENLENTSGRGVMLIRVFMDKVAYNDKGNSVELFKVKAAQRDSAPD